MQPNLTRPLTLEAPTETADGAGGLAQGWTALGQLWAEMRPRAGSETSGQEAALSRARWTIITRAAPFGAPSRPAPGQRFRDGARLFDILTVAEADPQARYLTISAEEERIR
ncbi:Phage head-tail joining protein [Rhodobacteraceae bacterium THAF1]|uniref:head-tail adaptor protein n=1 Tax=Palleronia sp. THAF1 TaxID=2587842 RepID=UPI000F3B58EF|nr:head-tail adaptor protein [Palleronia sp. THAF1]QFU08260.1 Phage head-tail joining protein [Palleronia sp. THAF1]VDC28831.1 Phage head-tail joining protein [Rhodobacteraceae bacterium THAF1]